MDGYSMNNRVVLLHLPIMNYLEKDFVNEESGYNPSLGIMALGTYLELNGYEPIVIDMCYERMKVKELVKHIKIIDPLFVGISVYTENFNQAVKLAHCIKLENKNIKILFGGPHPTLQPMECIEKDPVDFVAMKEGESILLELAEAIRTEEKILKYEDIKGLVFKRNGIPFKNKYKNYISDLDLLPIIKRELVNIKRYGGYVNISTSRGCPGRCIYCSATALSGASYRVRSEYSIYLEMLLIKTIWGEKVYKIYIVDDTFTAIPKRLNNFMDLIEKYQFKINWQCESRVDVMNETLLVRMHETGCIAIQYGIESGCQEVLDKLQKGIDLEKAKEIINLTYKNKIIPCLSFMLGHYCDTKETMWQTAYLVKELFEKYKAEIAVSYNTPFPGTLQYIKCKELGMKLLTQSYEKYTLLDPIVETENFTADDQREIFYFCSKYIGHYDAVEKRAGGHTYVS